MSWCCSGNLFLRIQSPRKGVPLQNTSNVKLKRPKSDLSTQCMDNSAVGTMTDRGMITMGEENIPANTDHGSIKTADNVNACPNPEMMFNCIPRGKQLRRTIHFDSSPLQNMPDPMSCEDHLPQPAKCNSTYNTPQMKPRTNVLPNSVPRGRELQRTPPGEITPRQGLNCDNDRSQATGADNFLTPAQREPLSTPCSHVISSLRRQASKPILSGGGSIQHSVSVFTPNSTRGRIGVTATPQRTKDRNLKSKIPAFGSAQSSSKPTQQDATSMKHSKKLLVTTEKENWNIVDPANNMDAVDERMACVAKDTYLSPGIGAIPMGRQLQRTPPEGTGTMEINQNEDIKRHLQFSEKQEANLLEILPHEERTRVSSTPVPDRKSNVLLPLCFNAAKSDAMELQDDCLSVQPEPSKDTNGTEHLQNKKMELEIQHQDILKRKERLAKICDEVEDDMKQLMDGYQKTISRLEGVDASKPSVEMPPRGQFSKQASPDDITGCTKSDDTREGIDQQSPDDITGCTKSDDTRECIDQQSPDDITGCTKSDDTRTGCTKSDDTREGIDQQSQILQDESSREKEDIKNSGASDKILKTDQERQRHIETQHGDNQTTSESDTMQTQLTALDERIKSLEKQAKETTDPERRTSKNRLLRLLQRCEQSLKRKSAVKKSQRYS